MRHGGPPSIVASRLIGSRRLRRRHEPDARPAVDSPGRHPGGEFWLDEPNQRALQGFLRFVGGRSAESERLRPFGERGGASIREPVVPCGTGSCEPGPPP